MAKFSIQPSTLPPLANMAKPQNLNRAPDHNRGFLLGKTLNLCQPLPTFATVNVWHQLTLCHFATHPIRVAMAKFRRVGADQTGISFGFKLQWVSGRPPTPQNAPNAKESPVAAKRSATPQPPKITNGKIACGRKWVIPPSSTQPAGGYQGRFCNSVAPAVRPAPDAMQLLCVCQARWAAVRASVVA